MENSKLTREQELEIEKRQLIEEKITKIAKEIEKILNDANLMLITDHVIRIVPRQ